jgi:hypothetical protein
MSSLTYSKNLAKSSCELRPTHLIHKNWMEKKKKNPNRKAITTSLLGILTIEATLGNWKKNPTNYTKEQGVCQIVALPFTLKKCILRQKRRIMETQIFHHAKI